MQNTSLDEFLEDESDGRSGPGGESGDGGSTDRDRPRENKGPGDSTDSGAGTPGEAEAGDTPGRDGGDSEDPTDPPTPASRWQPDGQDCARCERSVTRLWSDDGRLVCADCKDWA